MAQRRLSPLFWFAISIGTLFAVSAIAGMLYAGYVGFRQFRDGETANVAVDEAYRIKLESPGSSWTVMNAEEARRISPEARLGARARNALFAMVVVEAAPNVSLQDYVASADLSSMVSEVTVESTETGKFAGTDAIRERVKGRGAGSQLRMDRTTFMHQGHAYQILVWGPEQQADAQGAFAEPIRAAFTLLPGTVRPEAAPAIPKTSRVVLGPDDRTHADGWESAAGQVRLRLPTGWRVGNSVERTQMDAESHAVFLHETPQVFATLTAEPAVEGDSESAGSAEESLSLTRGYERAAGAAPLVLDVGGKPTRFTRLRVNGAMGAQLYLGTACRRDRCLRILMWHLDGIDGTLEPMKAFAGGVEWLGDDEVDRLWSELDGAPDHESWLPPEAVIRNGVWLDFAGGLAWKKPARAWRASPMSGGAAGLSVELREVGLRGQISEMDFEDDPSGLADSHAQLIARWEPRKAAPRTKRTLGGLVLHESELETDQGTVWVATVERRGQRSVAFQLWCPTHQAAKARPHALAAIQALSFHDLKPTEAAGSVYMDRRFGFELRPPDASWARKEIPIAGMQPGSVASLGWQSGDRSIEVAMLPTDVMVADHDGLMDTMMDSLLAEFSAAQKRAAKRETRMFQGREARSLRMSTLGTDFEMLAFSVPGRIVLLSARDSGLGAKAPVRELDEGFRLVDLEVPRAVADAAP